VERADAVGRVLHRAQAQADQLAQLDERLVAQPRRRGPFRPRETGDV